MLQNSLEVDFASGIAIPSNGHRAVIDGRTGWFMQFYTGAKNQLSV